MTEGFYKLRDFKEERTRTLYVRLPHRIRNTKDVQDLFEGNAKVKLPRQASRACHVIFSNVEEKKKGLENLKDKTMNGKKIVAFSPKTKPMEKRIKPKKIVVPIPDPEQKITQTLFISNITDQTTIADLKKAFPGSGSVVILGPSPKGLRSAFVKMRSIQEAGQYLRKEKEWPEVNGNKLSIHEDRRISKGRRGAKNKRKKPESKVPKYSINKIEDTEENDQSESENDTKTDD